MVNTDHAESVCMCPRVTIRLLCPRALNQIISSMKRIYTLGLGRDYGRDDRESSSRNPVHGGNTQQETHNTQQAIFNHNRSTVSFWGIQPSVRSQKRQTQLTGQCLIKSCLVFVLFLNKQYQAVSQTILIKTE